jgi:hypothetical protein
MQTLYNNIKMMLVIGLGKLRRKMALVLENSIGKQHLKMALENSVIKWR